MKTKLLSAFILSMFLIIPLHAENGDHQFIIGPDGQRQQLTPDILKNPNFNAAGKCELPTGEIVDKSEAKARAEAAANAKGGNESNGGGEGGGESYPSTAEGNDGASVNSPMFASCNSCHGVNRSAISSVSAGVARVRAGTMPPNKASLSEQDRAAILALDK